MKKKKLKQTNVSVSS